MNANHVPIALPSGTTLVTVNNRLKSELQRQYDRHQAAAGLRAWPTPDITPWSAWLRRGYEQLLDSGFTTRILLNPHQERLLWERAVQQSREGGLLLRPAAAARTAQQAWQLVNDWQLQREQLLDNAADETRIYLAWQAQFSDLCARQQLISNAELPSLLCQAAMAGALECADTLQLAGFDAITPAQQALWDALRARGVTIAERQPTTSDSQCRRLALPDPEIEIRNAAAWARAFTEQHPGAQVAIVSPRLEQQRDMLSRLCAATISPHSLLPGQPHRPGFNLSLGRPLADYPLVAQLLLTLRLALKQPLSTEDIGSLLRSPFIGGHAAEWDSRAQLDFALRDDGLPQLDVYRLLARARQFEHPASAHAPLLIERLEGMLALLDQLPTEDTPNAWSGHLLRLIACLGWPGDSPLDSSEYQQAAKLRDTVSTFSTLARVQPRMRLPEVLRRLTQLCEDSVFQPQGEAAPIQVLGILEAAGMQFDAIWLLGMDDQAWPPAPAPNPLLPTRLQRELGMPHASAERELRFARHLTGRLLASAPQVIVSHALKDGDREQRPSPLTAGLPLVDEATLGIDRLDELYAGAQHPGITDTLPAPEAAPPQGSPAGGSRLLSDQSACPFRAVARHRLKAQPLPETSAAPSPALLGNMVHQLLQGVWNEIRSAERLRSLDDAALMALIEPRARSTLAELGRHRPDVFTPAFVELEVQRLCELLLAWLDLERQRALPFEVLSTEQRQQAEIAGLSLKLRADRIDRLDDGSLVIIDYKTGETANANGWTEPRPTELQVPLYCVQATQPPAAALIARVHARSTRFLGCARDEDIVPSIDAYAGDEAIPDWNALLDHWRNALHMLASEIRAGRADIDPQDAATCNHCELGSLCRIGSLLDHSRRENPDD